MKNELRISTLSIVCVLCAAFSAPVFGAPAVRALGGVGTYSSASNAASAKDSGATASALTPARSGVVRANSNSSNSGAVASTRTSAIPRLSIGKYLSNNAVLGGNATTGTIKPGQSDNGNGNLQERIRILEQHLGYKGDGSFSQDGRVEKVELDVAKLKTDMSVLTAGAVTGVEYAGGVLTVYELVDGKESKTEYDLNEDFVGRSELDVLEEKLNQIVLGSYVSKEDFDAAIADLQAKDVLLQQAIDVLDGVDAAQLAEVQRNIAALLVSDAKNVEDIAALQLAVSALESDNIVVKDTLQKVEDSLTNFVTVATLTNYYTKDEVDALVRAAGNFDSTKYYTKEELDAGFATKSDIPVVPTKVSEFENDALYVTATDLKAVDDVAKSAKNMADLNAEAIADLENTYATKDALADAKEELGQQIQGLTGGKALGALAYKDVVATADIENAAVTADKINTTSLGNGGMAIVQNTAAGTKLVPVVIIDQDGNPVL